MEKEKKICGNCMTCCVHEKTKSVYVRHEEKDENGNVWAITKNFDHYEHFCDIGSPEYDAWHKRNEDKTYPQYSLDYCSCYEPTEYTKTLEEMKDLAQEIIDNIDKKKNKID